MYKLTVKVQYDGGRGNLQAKCKNNEIGKIRADVFEVCLN